MRKSMFAAAFVFGAVLIGSAGAQQANKPAEPFRAPAALNVAAIRAQAAQMAEFRSLLADPDPNVRSLTMREAIRSGDGNQREMAIEAGLASNEAAMMSGALRGMLANVQHVVFDIVDSDGKPVPKNMTAIVLHIAAYDIESGKLSGSSPWGEWSGQMQGNVLSFSSKDAALSGNLIFSADTGDFRGRVNANGRADASLNVQWKVR